MMKTSFLLAMSLVIWSQSWVKGEQSLDLSTCEDQLEKYRKFLAEAIFYFDDACEIYDALETEKPINRDYNLKYAAQANKPIGPKGGWAFFNILATQFSDLELNYILKKIIGERCREEDLALGKRDGVIIGKKQRFHSWGGKRSGLFTPGLTRVSPISYLPWYGQVSY